MAKYSMPTEQLIEDPHRHFPCRIPVCAAYTPRIDLPLRYSFCLCCCHRTIVADGTVLDIVASADWKRLLLCGLYFLFKFLTLTSSAFLIDARRCIFDSPRSICDIMRSMSCNSWQRSQNT